MPQEREHDYPHVTAEEWQKIKADTPRETVAARVLMANNVTGIPRRPYLTGGSDHAPIFRSVERFTAAVYVLLDALETEPSDIGHNPEITSRISALREMMENPDGL